MASKHRNYTSSKSKYLALEFYSLQYQNIYLDAPRRIVFSPISVIPSEWKTVNWKLRFVRVTLDYNSDISWADGVNVMTHEPDWRKLFKFFNEICQSAVAGLTDDG